MSQPVLNRLVFAGEAIIDLLMWVPALPERGGDMLADAAAIEVGGGFNIMAAALPSGLETFIEHVLPILRRKGLFREEYTGTTLREHYGLSVPTSRSRAKDADFPV